ncbi:MAG: putative addiction module antidote protein [Endomicrobium sp.]|jgi:probable addiction module antidote protein|nr:putative addiction module antidote protein [Endomicrobium sp.]
MRKENLALSDFDEDFAASLKDNPKKLSNFIKFIIKKYEKDGDFGTFLEGVNIVARATKGMTEISKETKISRDTLYKAFSRKGNPEAKTYFDVLKSIGIRIHYDYAPKY